MLTLEQYGHWQSRMEIEGLWDFTSGRAEAHDAQPFTVIYSSRQWHSAEVWRLVCESFGRSLDLVKALRGKGETIFCFDGGSLVDK